MQKLSRFKAIEIIESSRGRVFSCSFTKKDGSQRKMIARMGVHKNLKGGKSAAAGHNSLITVFDMVAGEYRMVNLATLSALRVNGESYEVV